MKVTLDMKDNPKWEYRTEYVEARNWDIDMGRINCLGVCGWEIVAFVQQDNSFCVWRVVMKRQVNYEH